MFLWAHPNMKTQSDLGDFEQYVYVKFPGCASPTNVTLQGLLNNGWNLLDWKQTGWLLCKSVSEAELAPEGGPPEDGE